jgi:hypothetical protein
MDSQKVHQAVTPAKAGVQKRLKGLDSRLRGNDKKERFLTFYEIVNVDALVRSWKAI